MTYERQLDKNGDLLDYIFQATDIKLGDFIFQTQVGGDDNARPDMVGQDSEGLQVVIIEAKFWAGLTTNQPVTYLERLPQHVDSVLLFLAPATIPEPISIPGITLDKRNPIPTPNSGRCQANLIRYFSSNNLRLNYCFE